MTDNFDMLAVRVLAGEASPGEQTRLQTMLERDARLREEFEDLRIAREALHRFASLSQAMDAPPALAPGYRLAELDTAVRSHFRGRASGPARSPFGFFRAWLTQGMLLKGAVALGLLVIAGWLILGPGGRPSGGQSHSPIAYLTTVQGPVAVVRGGKTQTVATTIEVRAGDQIQLGAGAVAQALTPSGVIAVTGPRVMAGGELETAGSQSKRSVPATSQPGGAVAQLRSILFGPAQGLLAMAQPPVTRGGGQAITLYSPRQATRNLEPVILWKCAPGKKYDLTIRDENDERIPAWRLSGVVSPVDFRKVAAWQSRPLATNALYRLGISETGDRLSICDYTFQTLDGRATQLEHSPAGKIAEAYELLAREDLCLGDTLAELLTLPPEWAESEVVLRLKLALFSRLGLSDDYEAAAAKLNAMTNPHSQ